MKKRPGQNVTVQFDSRREKATGAVAKWFAASALAGVPLFALTWNTLLGLQQELGSAAAAWNWICERAIEYERPIVCGLPNQSGSGMGTAIVGPPGWSDMKLQGFIAGYRDAIEEQFGEITSMTALPRE